MAPVAYSQINNLKKRRFYINTKLISQAAKAKEKIANPVKKYILLIAIVSLYVSQKVYCATHIRVPIISKNTLP